MIIIMIMMRMLIIMMIIISIIIITIIIIIIIIIIMIIIGVEPAAPLGQADREDGVVHLLAVGEDILAGYFLPYVYVCKLCVYVLVIYLHCRFLSCLCLLGVLVC